MSEKLFHMKQLEGDKITMEELLELIPELDDLFVVHESKSTFIPIYTHNGQSVVPEKILDLYHMTEDRLKEFLSTKSGNQIEFSSEGLMFQFNKNPFAGISPIKLNLESNSYVLPLKKEELFSVSGANGTLSIAL